MFLTSVRSFGVCFRISHSTLSDTPCWRIFTSVLHMLFQLGYAILLADSFSVDDNDIYDEMKDMFTRYQTVHRP